MTSCSADEWFEVCRKLRPDLGRPEFDRLWAAFQRDKRQRKRRGVPQ